LNFLVGKVLGGAQNGVKGVEGAQRSLTMHKKLKKPKKLNSA
jgi:hypothetical protein